MLTLLLHHRYEPKPPEPSTSQAQLVFSEELSAESPPSTRDPAEANAALGGAGTCATVERMGEEAAGRGSPEQVSLGVRELIQRHFQLHGAFRSVF
jgi:hypothetical protein